MASISISGLGTERIFTLEVEEIDFSNSDNTSTVSWTLSATGDGGTGNQYYLNASVNGVTLFSGTSTNPLEFPTATGTRSGNLIVDHDNDGTKTINFHIEASIAPSTPTQSNGTLQLHNLNRNAPDIRTSAPTDITATGVTIRANSIVPIDAWSWRYKRAGDAWEEWEYHYEQGTATSYTIVINMMFPSSDYTIQVTGRSAVNGVWGWAPDIKIRTQAIAKIVNVGDATLGQPLVVTFRTSQYEEGMTYRLRYIVDDYDYMTDAFTVETVTSAYAYTLPLTVADQINFRDVTSRPLSVTLFTYGADESLQGRDNKRVRAILPDSVIPTIDSFTIEEGEERSGFGNLYVKTLSTMFVEIEANGIYGSRVTSVTLDIDGDLYTPTRTGTNTWEQESGMLSTFNEDDGIPVTVTVTDSRGRVCRQTLHPLVYNYYVPTLYADVQVYGPTVNTRAIGSIASVNGLNQKRLTIVRRKIIDGTTQTYNVNPLPSYDYSQTWQQTIADASRETYEYTVTVYDKLNSVTAVVVTGVTCISRHRGGRGVTLFGEAESDGFVIVDSLTGDYICHQITSADYLEIANIVATTYEQKNYSSGEWCEKDGYIYEAKQDITAEAWTASHWEQLGGAT